jgi:hypothetical protein
MSKSLKHSMRAASRRDTMVNATREEAGRDTMDPAGGNVLVQRDTYGVGTDSDSMSRGTLSMDRRNSLPGGDSDSADRPSDMFVDDEQAKIKITGELKDELLSVEIFQDYGDDQMSYTDLKPTQLTYCRILSTRRPFFAFLNRMMAFNVIQYITSILPQHLKEVYGFSPS